MIEQIWSNLSLEEAILMQNGVITGRIIERTAFNSLQFRGFIENGVETNFFPVLSQ